MVNPLALALPGLGIMALAVPSTSPPPSLPSPGLTLVLVVALEDDCRCIATTGDDVNHDDRQVPCGAQPGNAPVILVSTTELAHSTCTKNGATCEDPATPNKCTATVTAQLQWPTNPCYTSLGVTGPGIGTGGSCETSTAPNNLTVEWDLDAECKIAGGGQTDAGTTPLQIYTGGCDENDEPVSTPAASYNPTLNCGECKLQPAPPD